MKSANGCKRPFDQGSVHTARSLFEACSTMPPAVDSDDDADDNDDIVGKKTKPAKVHVSMANLTTVVIQNWNRSGIHAPLLAPLHLGDLHYKSNISSLLAALLRNKHALQWSEDGKTVWHPGFPGQTLVWQEPRVSSHKPKAVPQKAPPPKRAANGKRPLGDATNDADRDGANEPTAVAPQFLQLQAAPSSERLEHGSRRVGTGFGNVAAPLQTVCMAEQGMLDKLWVWSNNHGRMCGGALSRVNSDVACWGCHSVGEVNTFRLVCSECDSAFNWSSAAPLPGAPLRTRKGSGTAATDAPQPAATATAGPTAAAPAAAPEAPPAGAADAPPAAADPLPDAEELRKSLRAALEHQRRWRLEYSLTAVAGFIASSRYCRAAP